MAGHRWRRAPQECPEWCAGGHRCTADYPAGEHRSEVLSWRTRYGRFVATRTANRAGRSRLELRATVRLPDEETAAHRVASTLCVSTDATIREVCGMPTRLEETR